MRYVVPIDSASLPAGTGTRLLAGPANGTERCEILHRRIAGGQADGALRSYPVDHFYYTLAGSIDLEIGDEAFALAPDTLAHVPAGVPHRAVNARRGDSTQLEVFSPATDGAAAKLEVARRVAGAAAMIRPVTPEGYKPGNVADPDRFQVHELIMRRTGSNHLRLYSAKVGPGGGGPPLHVHTFDQFYVVLEGTLEITIGTRVLDAEAPCLVVLPEAVVHTNRNSSGAMERHLALVTPEPRPGEALDIPVKLDFESGMRA